MVWLLAKGASAGVRCPPLHGSRAGWLWLGRDPWTEGHPNAQKCGLSHNHTAFARLQGTKREEKQSLISKRSAGFNTTHQGDVLTHHNRDEGLTAQLLTTEELRTQHNITKGKLKTLLAHERVHRIFRGMYATCKICPTIIARGLIKARPDVTFEGKTAIEIYLDQPLTFPLYAQVNDHSHHVGLQHLVKFRRTRKTHRTEHNGLPVIPLAHLITDIIHTRAHESAHTNARTSNDAGIVDLLERYYWLDHPNDLELHLLRPDSVVPAQLIETFESYYQGKLGKQLLATHIQQLHTSRDTARVKAIEEFITCIAVVGADSRLEIKCVLALRRVGFSATTQIEVGSYRWDLGIEELNLVIDIDSERYHQQEAQAFYADRWKTNDAVLHGKHIMRIGGACCDAHFDQIVLRLEAMRNAQNTTKTRPTAQKATATNPTIQPAWKWHTKLRQQPAVAYTK